MAYEIPDQVITLPATTGIPAFRFVNFNGSKLVLATSEGDFDGVTYESSTGSTADRSVGIITQGVARVTANGSTASAGDQIAVGPGGRAMAVAAGDYVVGKIIDGTSGSTGRVVTVLLKHTGTT